ncbi:MAG: chromosome segregation protein SMC [Clostridia bacterium]|nr:chromosome segregation protein SMC [Clostridia bacterium]
MQLKRIELQGFKSFAEKTIIEVEPGITTIVGPNGSGKSNISDAIRWVLGEQSAKSLRGSNMQDVIFSGTEQRKALGMAEVTIVLDNTDKSLPLEFAEVSVTRRVFRSGESEYYINRSQSRLKDVQELFMDTGVGRDGYSIVGQGKIDSIISSKSDERRSIFEEASGIVKYRTRKDEALRKLENTNINLDRVRDILQEIENNLKPLEEKSIVAKKYLEKRDELKNIDIKLFVDLVENTQGELGELNAKVQALSESVEQNEENINKIQRSREETRVALEEILQDTEKAQESYYKCLNEKDKLSSKIEAFDDRMKQAEENIEKLKQEIVEGKTSIDLLQQEIVTRNTKKNNMQQNKERFVVELEEKETELKEIISNMSAKELEIEELKSKTEELKEEQSEIRLNIATNTTKIETAKARLEVIQKSNTKDISNSDALKIEVEEIKDEYSSKKKQKEDAENKLNLISKEKEELEKYFSSIASKEADLKQKIIEAKSKLGYMTNLENENAGYISSVKSIMDLTKRNEGYKSKVFGTLAGLVSTEEKYEKAIEIAMGGYLQNIVVDTDKTARDLVQFLKDGMLGRATFLPIESIRLYKDEIPSKAKNCNGFLGTAIELITFDKKFEAVIRLALGRTIIVDTLENGIKMSKVTGQTAKIVTLAGEIISTTGSITGGQANVKQVNLVGRSRKLSDYQKMLDTAVKEYEDFTNSFKDKKNRYEEISQNLIRVKSELDKLIIEYTLVEQKLAQAIKETDKLKNIREQKDDEKVQLETSIKNWELENEKLNEKMQELEEQVVKLKEEIYEFTRFNKEKEAKISLLNEDIVNLKVSVSSFDESALSIDEMVEKINLDIANFYESIERKEQLILSYTEELSKGEENNLKDIEELKNIEEASKETLSVLEKLKQDKSVNISRQEELEKELLSSIEVLDKLKSEKSKVEAKKAKFDAEVEMLKVKIWEEYELTSSGAKEFAKGLTNLDNISRVKLEQRASKLKQEIKDLGEVSVNSIQEYKDLTERFSFISNQKIDLEDTKSKLENLIDNTTSVMKTQFAKQFRIINDNFKSVFVELFGGGKAELRLTDEANILESGIEIVAEPPGKKLQNLSLLSGGEKALTAIAILFSILKIKSPPFCILDEIEAALDDINVARFASYIKKYSDETQFLVITHRKGTMEIASSVYGVTMQEYGVSKLISMKMK